MDLDAYGWMFRAVVKAGARFSNRPDAITCNSEAGIAVHEALGYRPRRFILVDNGIDTGRFKPDTEARSVVRQELGIAPDTLVISTAARVDPMKDYANLLAALDRLPGVTAIVMGDGTEALPERPDLIRLGRCDRVPQILAAADVIVSASAYGEGFSIAEGMSCGLPAVATDVGDARRIVGPAGTIVAPRNAAALAVGIRQFIESPNRLSTGRAARERIEKEFSLDRAVARFRALHGG
jgi:glycosyltransferase involved in cell wall biosynthesis